MVVVGASVKHNCTGLKRKFIDVEIQKSINAYLRRRW